jgi:hypothetical protein
MIHVSHVLSGGEQEARSEVSRDFPRDCANDERRTVGCQGRIEDRKGVRTRRRDEEASHRIEHRVNKEGKKRDLRIEEKHEITHPTPTLRGSGTRLRDGMAHLFDDGTARLGRRTYKS